MKRVIDYCESNNCRYIENAPLCEYTTFRTGGPCTLMCFPDSKELVAGLIALCSEYGITFRILGKGSNVLADDKGFSGVIINTVQFDGIHCVSGDTLECACGTTLMKVCRTALDLSLSGLEFAFGIPGSVGGAVYMNAGAYGGEIKDVLTQVEYTDSSGNIGVRYPDELALGYRTSVFKTGGEYILGASFRLIPSEKNEIRAKMEDFLGRRKSKQPLEFPSAGSTFKRPEGYFAGALIEECGLKGKSVGGAQVSEKHAGFIINRENATSDDVKELINYCQDCVFENKGVRLEREVEYI